MPDGLVLYVAGLACLGAFVAVVAREDRATGGIATPSASGWLLLGLAAVCFVGGTWQLAAGMFSG